MIFIDTGAFLARYLPSDQHHGAAVTAWRQLDALEPRLFTSDHVLSETFTLLGRRASYAFAAERARAVYASAALTILRAGEDDDRAALRVFEKYADQRVSFTDCLSFALMGREGVRRAFTFDRHFRAAGFEVVPG